MANKNLNEAREMLVQKYLESLSQNQLPWDKPWQTNTPKNALSGRKYNGVNRMLLSYVAEERGYKGARWCTFNQIADRQGKYHKDEKWHLKQGSKSVPIEYWFIYNPQQKKSYSFQEFAKIAENIPEEEKDNYKLTTKTFRVFNEDCIEGISPEPVEERNIKKSDYISAVISEMGVNYKERGDSCYYSPRTDTVNIAPKDTFRDEYGYYASQLHELCHATGHKDRLNRDLENWFGTPEYAKEELRAEISSSFLMQDFKLEADPSHINNHVAYIQSWIETLKKNPNELFKAIKDADKIAEYIEEKAKLGLEKSRDNEVLYSQANDITVDSDIDNETFEKLLDSFDRHYSYFYANEGKPEYEKAGVTNCYKTAIGACASFMQQLDDSKLYSSIVKKYTDKTQDYLSSDREYAAFAFALADVGVINKFCDLDIDKPLNEAIRFSADGDMFYDANTIEKEIPHWMRFKEANTSLKQDGGIYWVTQETFDYEDLETFQKAMQKLDIPNAYVTVRDISSYNYEQDKQADVLVEITKEEIGSVNGINKALFEVRYGDEYYIKPPETLKKRIADGTADELTMAARCESTTDEPMNGVDDSQGYGRGR